MSSNVSISFPEFLKDSLKNKNKYFENLVSDTVRLKFLVQLSDSNPIYRKEILKHIISSCPDTQLSAYKITAYYKLGKDLGRRNIKDSAVYYFKKGIAFCEKNKLKSKAVAMLYREFGSFFTRINNYADGFQYYKMAIGMCEKIGDNDGYMTYLSEMGKIHQSINEFDKAANCFQKAKKYAIKTNNYSLQIFALNSLGDLYRILNKLDSAILFHEQALQIHKKFRQNTEEFWAITSLGKIYAKKNDFEKAEKYFGIILSDAKANKFGDLAAQSYLQLAICDLKRGNIKRAIQNAEEGYRMSLTHPDLELQSTMAKMVSDAYLQNKQFDKSLEYYKTYALLYDSIENVEQVKKMAQFEFDQKEELLIGKIEQNAEKLRLRDEKSAQEAKRNAIIIVSVSLLLCMAVIFAIFVYRSLQRNKKQNIIIQEQKIQVEKQRDLIEKKQEEIVSSIHYAKSIQKTLLTNQDFLNENIPQNFILYKPKDIVSGDFYWAARHENKFYLAVCDSTGHGVPGAFMSLLNIGFLSEAINEKKITDPSTVFNYVRERLTNSISTDSQKDGFDGILVCIDLVNNEIEYAAANNNPVLLRNNVCEDLPFDKMPVGAGPKNDPFKTYRLNLQAGDILYLFTDGFEDQFGGPEGKKFMYKNLQRLLARHASVPLKEQVNLLNQEFEKWKTHRGKDGNSQNFEQVDDVCIVGIRLS